MYYVYVLRSDIDSELYIGYTNDLRRRLAEHNSGKSASTAPRRPFTLLYYEAYRERSDAQRREKALKLRGQARVHLLSRLTASLRLAQN